MLGIVSTKEVMWNISSEGTFVSHTLIYRLPRCCFAKKQKKPPTLHGASLQTGFAWLRLWLAQTGGGVWVSSIRLWLSILAVNLFGGCRGGRSSSQSSETGEHVKNRVWLFLVFLFNSVYVLITLYKLPMDVRIIIIIPVWHEYKLMRLALQFKPKVRTITVLQNTLRFFKLFAQHMMSDYCSPLQ